MAWDLYGGQQADVFNENKQNEAKPCSVTDALLFAKSQLEGVQLCVEGEVSQVKDGAGYKAIYFTLADEQSALDCMMWRRNYLAAQLELRPGLKVQITGHFSVYPAKGRMQFEALKLGLAGEGDLRARVDKLARKLAAEGLMDPARKRKPPEFCQRVVVITSPNGKVKDDVARTLRRRNPLVELIYCPVTVEGATAASQMTYALSYAAAIQPDAILLVRGGGSYEDLMPFNDESLARAIVACPIPVITGIGHEPDTTICDMVADVRASTPTAAAESVAPAAIDLLNGLNILAARMYNSMQTIIGQKKQQLASVSSRPILANPVEYLYKSRSDMLDLTSDRLHAALPNMITRKQEHLNHTAQRLIQASRYITVRGASSLERLVTQMINLGPYLYDSRQKNMAVLAGKLNALSPLAVLSRGYSIVYNEDNRIVSKADQLGIGSNIEVRLSDAQVAAKVTGIKPAD
ncbi:MAG: exodeoxyribonuclease VII large subunit [Coriobacteriales bacterium]|nr:exodeoxyribonuclease VII large subunit [Coriobacteriales bacterium]